MRLNWAGIEFLGLVGIRPERNSRNPWLGFKKALHVRVSLIIAPLLARKGCHPPWQRCQAPGFHYYRTVVMLSIVTINFEVNFTFNATFSVHQSWPTHIKLFEPSSYFMFEFKHSYCYLSSKFLNLSDATPKSTSKVHKHFMSVWKDIRYFRQPAPGAGVCNFRCWKAPLMERTSDRLRAGC